MILTTRLIKILIVHLFLVCPIAISQANELYIQSHNLYDSEPVPYNNFEKDWTNKYRSGKRALTYQWHELGVTHNNWGFGFFQKRHTYMKFKTDTALAVHTISGEQPLKNTSYEVDLEAKYYNSYGFKLFNTIVNKPSVQWTLGLSLIYGEALIDGSLKGSISALSESDYQFNNIVLDYYYSKDELFDHKAPRPSSEGFSFDSEISWQPSEKLRLQFIARDLAGRIYWKNAPTTVAVIESDNKTYDENGYVKVDATLKGNQSTKNFIQHLAPYMAFQSEIDLNENFELLFEVEHYYIKTYQHIGLGKKFPLNIQAQLSYEFATQSIGMLIKHPNIELQFLTDHFNQAKAHVLGIKLSSIYEF